MAMRYIKHSEKEYLKLKLRIIEIESHFKVNLTRPDRSINIVYLKAIIANEFKYINHISVGKAFGVVHASIINLHKIFNRLKNNVNFIYLMDAYEKRDIEMYNKFCKIIKERPKIKKIINKPFQLNISIKEVIPILKKNSKHYLWNKSFEKWEMKDWKEFNKLKGN